MLLACVMGRPGVKRIDCGTFSSRPARAGAPGVAFRLSFLVRLASGISERSDCHRAPTKVNGGHVSETCRDEAFHHPDASRPRGPITMLLLVLALGCARVLGVPGDPRLASGAGEAAEEAVPSSVETEASAAARAAPGTIQPGAAEATPDRGVPEATLTQPGSSAQDIDPVRTPAASEPAETHTDEPPDAAAAPPTEAGGTELSCASDAECPDDVCDTGTCRAARCDDARRNGAETDVDCGGACLACGVGAGCSVDAECSTNVCEEGHCCGGDLADCTRCARRLAGTNTCALGGAAEEACNAFLQCLADNSALCPTRLARGCSKEADAGCDVRNFGGNGGPAIKLADSILGTARCRF